MAITYKVHDFPTLPVRAQLFYAGGAAFEAGFTSGGVRVTSPEPGGRAYLETELSLQTDEFDAPWFSWLMSKAANGEIFKIRLTATPQLVAKEKLSLALEGLLWDNDQPWDNDQMFDNASNGDVTTITSNISAVALEGSTTVVVDLSNVGAVLKKGRVIGISANSYMVDDISYTGTTATITVNPPLRKDFAVGEDVLFRGYFTGSIMNAAELRVSYEAINAGNIKPPRIVFSEVII